MNFKRIATIIGVAVLGYFGFYIVDLIYNVFVFLFIGGKDAKSGMAILTAIIAATIYTIKTRRQ
ncbi:hypothetical protein [uncultured Gemmiger sp.]|uniref:hypothetical protein n=1 Tax=uncultured Gemmiger sp. TaxID=1623490 RepID=UPI0025F34A54|nr:hypothetical protein [uncultured Gemmiger sp.]